MTCMLMPRISMSMAKLHAQWLQASKQQAAPVTPRLPDVAQSFTENGQLLFTAGGHADAAAVMLCQPLAA